MLLSFSPIEFNNRGAFSFCSGRSEPVAMLFQACRAGFPDLGSRYSNRCGSWDKEEITVETTQRQFLVPQEIID